MVARRHPRMNDVLRDDAVERADTAKHRGTTQAVEENASRPRSVRLFGGPGIGAEAVRRLVVAHGLEITGHGRGAGVEKGPFHAVAPIAIALDAIHPRRGEQHRGHVAGLGLAERADARRVFLAGGHAVREDMVIVEPPERAQRRLELVHVAGPWIDQGGEADIFVEDDHMAGRETAVLPVLDVLLHGGLRDALQGALEDSRVAAEGIRFKHRIQIAQAGHVEEVERPHVRRVIGIDFDQRIENALLAGALIERHQRPAHLRMRPTVEALRFVSFPPVDE